MWHWADRTSHLRNWSSIASLAGALLLMMTMCGWQWPQPQTDLPVELHLDRNYYTSEPVARIRAERRKRTGPLQIEFTLSGPDGDTTTLAMAPQDIPAGSRWENIWQIDISSLKPARYTLKFEIVDDRGQPVGEFEMPLVKHPPAEHEVKYDWDNNILINGEPFYPVGIYGTSTKTLGTIARQGFNCVVEWPFPNKFGEEDWQSGQLLDAAHQENLKVILFGPFLRPGHSQDYTLQQAIASVEEYKNHSALLAYSAVDEPVYHNVEYYEKVKGLCEGIQHHDPYHPVFVNHAHWKGPDRRWSGIADWAGIDLYPVGDGRLSLVEYRWMHLGLLADNSRVPMVWVPQAYAHPNARMPSRLEFRHMVYLPIIRGAKAVLIYSYKRWPFFVRYMGDVVQELRQISPILLSDYPEILRPISEQRLSEHTAKSTIVESKHTYGPEYPDYWPDVAAAIWRSDSNVYVIATNRQNYPVRATFRLPRSKVSEIRVINEGRSLPFEHSRWTDDFGPIAVHIYELVAEKEYAQ